MVDITTVFVAVFVFAGFSMTSFLLLFFAGKIHGKKFSISWFVLSLGNVLLGWSYLIVILTVQDLDMGMLHMVLIITSMSLMILGTVSVFREKSVEIIALRNRYRELKDTMEHLKTKYMKREISEVELRDLHKDFLREMTEVEVKLKKIGGEEKDAVGT